MTPDAVEYEPKPRMGWRDYRIGWFVDGAFRTFLYFRKGSFYKGKYDQTERSFGIDKMVLELDAAGIDRLIQDLTELKKKMEKKA